MSSEKEKGKSKSSKHLAGSSDGSSSKGSGTSRSGSGRLTPTGASPPAISRIEEMKGVALGRKDSLGEVEEALQREKHLLEEERAKHQRQKDILAQKNRSTPKEVVPTTIEIGSFAPPSVGGSDLDLVGDGSDDEGDLSAPADEALAGKMQRQPRAPPKKMLKPRALSATIRRIEALPPVEKNDFPDEWGRHLNLVNLHIEEEPEEYAMPGETLAVKMKLVDDKQVVRIRSAKFHRYVGHNGLLYHVKLAETELYILCRLVLGDSSLEVVKPNQDDPYEHVIQSQDYTKSKSSSYYRPKAQSVYNTLGAIVEKDSLVLFIRVMVPSVGEGTDEPPSPYRLLFTTLNNIDPNEFSITRKIFVGEGVAPKARLVRKSIRREFIAFLRDFDARNSQLQDQLRQFEKKVKVASTSEPEDLLITVYDTIYTLNRSVTSKQNFNGKTVLHYVCSLGYLVVLKHILGKKLQQTEINLLDINTRTPLFYAAAFGHDEMVRALIENGATSHSKDVRGETVIDIAIRLGQIKVVHVLNELKERQKAAAAAAAAASQVSGPSSAAAPAARNNLTMRSRAPSQLHQAARGGDVGKLSELVQETRNGAPNSQQGKPSDDAGAGTIDVKNEEGATALHIAAASGNIKAVGILLTAGADINAIDDGGSTPLHQAVAAQQLDVVKALVEAGANLEASDDTGGSPLNLAAPLNHVEILNYLLSKKANINTVNERGFTPLHHAAAFGFLETVNALIAAKASVNTIAASDQSTPLHQAVFNGHHELIVPLINAGAEINSGDSKALHLACFNGHVKCVEILLQRKAKVSSVDAEKSTAMHKAAYNGHIECMKLLLNAGAKVDPKDNEGATPLHKAAFSGKVECAKLLISNGADIDAKDAFEGTALHNAAFQGHTDVAKLLIENGASLTVCDDHKSSVVHLAAMGGHVETLQLLVQKGGPLELQDDQGFTALMHAVPSMQCVEILLGANVKLNVQDNEGKTALFHAISKHFEPVAVKLIQAGADISIKSKRGESPLDFVSAQFKELISDAVKEARALSNRADTTTRNELFKEAVKKWNTSGPTQAIEFLVQNGALEKDSPDDIARFLFKENADLNPETLGEYISKKNNVEILSAFCKRLDFENLEFDQALRQFLQKFRLPGEAQLIDRCMEAFAHRYFENNPDTFPDQDTAFILAFSLIMLNTDAHNPNIPLHKKMTKEQFLKNNRGIWAGENPPQEYMETLYDNIVEEEITFRDKKEPSERSGFLKRQTGRFNWQKTWFALRDQCMFYWKNQPKADDEQPSGVVPLESIQLKIPKDPKSKNFSIVPAQEGGSIKTAKVQKSTGRIVQGTISELSVAAETREEMDAWVRAIRTQMSATPFYELISQRTTELTATHVAREQLFGVGAVVDFKEFYDMALLCESAYGSENDIKKTFGTIAVPYIGSVDMAYRFFIMRNDDIKRQQIIIVNNLFNSERIKKCWEDSQPFDWRDYFRLSDVASSILTALDSYLKKSYTTQVIGHSLGGLAAVFVAQQMQTSKIAPVSKVVTFGMPNFMNEKTAAVYRSLCIVRVVDYHDPVDQLFINHTFLNRQVILLKQDYFCFRNLLPSDDTVETLSSPNSSASSTPPGSPKGTSRKGSDKGLRSGSSSSKGKDSDSDGSSESSSKKDKKDKHKDKSEAKRPPPDLKSHYIDYYLKRLKPKIKGPVQNVDFKDIKDFH